MSRNTSLSDRIVYLGFTPSQLFVFVNTTCICIFYDTLRCDIVGKVKYIVRIYTVTFGIGTGRESGEKPVRTELIGAYLCKERGRRTV